MDDSVNGEVAGPSRAGAWATSAWLAAMAAWYVWTAVYAVRHPLNGGADRKWALLWLAYAAGALLLHVRLRRPVATAVWSAGIAALAAAMIVASGGLLAALACLWLVTLAALLGSRLLRALRATLSDVPLEWSSMAIPTGLVLLSLAALALGLTRLLSPAGIAVLCAVLTGFEWRRLREGARRLPRLLSGARISVEQSLLAALCGFVALMNLAWALAPEIQYDALNYHLAVPRIFLDEGRVLDLPHFWHSYFAQLTEILFALCLALAGPIAAKLLVFSMGVVAALSVFALGRALFNARVGLWAGALFYATPMTAWLSSTTYTDLPAAFFLLACLIGFFRWRENREDGWLWASGLCAGAALGVKATAVYGLPVIGLAVLWDLARRREASVLSRLRSLAGLAAAAALTALPWYLVRYASTGNPFFPLAGTLFPGSRPVPADFDTRMLIREGFGRKSLTDLLELPFFATFRTNRLGEPFPAGALGVALAVLFPLGLILLARGKRRDAAVALGASLLSFVLWDRAFLSVRHVFAILPLTVVLAVASVDAQSPPGWRRRFHFGLLGAVLLAQVAEIPVQFWHTPDRIPVKVAFGRETPDHFLSRALPAHSAIVFLNKEARPGEKVVGFGVENARFYVRPRLDTVIETWDLQKEIMRAKGKALASDLVGMGYRYILIYGLPSRDPQFPFLEQSFLDNFATLEFNRRGGRVYRLGTRPQPAAAENLLANPGFEAFDEAGRPSAWTLHGHEAPRVARGLEHARSGSAAYRLTANQGVGQSVAVQGGRVYTLGHFLRAEGSHGHATLRADWFDARGTRLESSRQTVHAEPEWLWLRMTVTAPDASVRTEVVVSAHGDSRVLVDDVFFGMEAPQSAEE